MKQADECVNRIIDKFDSSKLSLRKLYNTLSNEYVVSCKSPLVWRLLPA